MGQPRAFLFDLDGVLTDTAKYHYFAWKEIADELGLLFDEKVNERLKGVSRRRSFEIILEVNHQINKFQEEEIEELLLQKNNRYCEMIKAVSQTDAMGGVVALLEQARRANVSLAVASASKNAKTIIEQLKLEQYFDFIADANKIANTKPDPEVFLVCAQQLGIANEDCVGFEDSQAGIEAIQAAGMFSVGIGVSITTVVPDYIVNTTEELSYSVIVKKYQNWKERGENI